MLVGKNIVNKKENYYMKKKVIIFTSAFLVLLLIVCGIVFFKDKKVRLLNYKIVLWPLFIVSVIAFTFLIVKVYLLSLL